MGKIQFNLHQDGSVTKSQIGKIFPRFSINQENDKIARKYFRENCPYMPTVLSSDELRAALRKYNLDLSYANFDQNVAVINVFEAVEMLAKLGVEVAWRELTWFKKMRGNGETTPHTDFLMFSLLLGIDCFPFYVEIPQAFWVILSGQFHLRLMKEIQY